MKICVIGALGFQDLANTTGGQPVKTRELYDTLCVKYRSQNLSFVDTYQWKKRPLEMLISLIRKIRSNDVIIMLPAHNGVTIFSSLLLILKKSTTKLFYSVIGGWLPERVKNDASLNCKLQKFDGIWVETTSMKNALNKQGLNNVCVVPNFKRLKVLKENELVYPTEKPYKVCTFSRVMKEKGIEDAITAVTLINQKYNEIIFFLDIYGPIDEGYKTVFSRLQKQFPDYIKYKGVVAPNDSVDVLKNYFALLFPTHYYTEGIPGTIIDAYMAGIPLIASLWVNSGDIFKEDETGYGYEFGKYSDLVTTLDKAYIQSNSLVNMKKNCLTWAEKYRPETVIEQISGLLNKS